MRLSYFIFALPFALMTSSTWAAISAINAQQCSQMKHNGVINNSAPVPCNRLKTVSFIHVDFSGNEQQGQLVVLDAVAPSVEKIMHKLYQARFPIHQAKPMQTYQGNDDLSMQENNTSAFNYRKIAAKKSVSLHAYGVAIDINPLQNPFVSFTSWGSATFKPLKGYQYLNRKQYRLGKEPSRGFAEQVVTLFAHHGFRTWGGDWNTPIDFQHFQTSRDMATLMVDLSSADAALFFNHYVDWYQQCSALSKSEQQTLRIIDYSTLLTSELKSTHLTTANRHNPLAFMKTVKAPKSANLSTCFN